ncbi:MAG: ExbD/TolR family protein [Geitlerinemataceae cyanobacterium]
MRFRSQNRTLGEIPEVDITPMLNVIMVVLAFFVVVSTTLGSPPSQLQVGLPETGGEDTPPPDGEQPLVLRIQLKADSRLLVDEAPMELNSILAGLPEFLQNNPDSTVFLIPDSAVDYQSVLEVFVKLQAIGGDRISLAVGANDDEDASPLE